LLKGWSWQRQRFFELPNPILILRTSIPPITTPQLSPSSSPHTTNLITSLINIILIYSTRHDFSLPQLSISIPSPSLLLSPFTPLNNPTHRHQRLPIYFLTSFLSSSINPLPFPFYQPLSQPTSTRFPKNPPHESIRTLEFISYFDNRVLLVTRRVTRLATRFEGKERGIAGGEEERTGEGQE